MKLLLSSFGSSRAHDAALVELVVKPLGNMRVAYIENAYDVSLPRSRTRSSRRSRRPYRHPHHGIRTNDPVANGGILAAWRRQTSRSLRPSITATATSKYTGFLLEGAMHGAWSWYRTDGSLMRTGEFDRGRQVGTWRTFDRQGAVVKETSFAKGPVDPMA